MKLNLPLLLLAAAEEYLDRDAYRDEWCGHGLCFYAANYADKLLPGSYSRMYEACSDLIVDAGLTGHFRSVTDAGVPLGYVGGDTGRTPARIIFVRALRDYLRSYAGLS